MVAIRHRSVVFAGRFDRSGALRAGYERSATARSDASTASLGSTFGCRGLMTEISRRRAFIPESTWLVVGPSGPCGTVQALRDRGVFGGIQNVGIVPEARGLGLGNALLLQSLQGMVRSGLGRGVLEVTAQNEPAIRLYQRLGFRRAKVVYKAVPPCLTPLGQETAIPVF